MTEEFKNDEVIDAEVNDDGVAEEKVSVLSKVKTTVKEYGPKVAKGAAIGAGLLIAFALGRSIAGSDDDDCTDDTPVTNNLEESSNDEE